MSQLTIYSQDKPEEHEFQSVDAERISAKLLGVGICFERWSSDHEVGDQDDNEAILAAYKTEIDKLVAARGYQSWDVVSMRADHPDKQPLREKFLAEHTHGEDEVRFFVRGQGLFVIHKEEKVFAVLCEKGDLISVPKGTKHWFDMGQIQLLRPFAFSITRTVGWQTSPVTKSPPAFHR